MLFRSQTHAADLEHAIRKHGGRKTIDALLVPFDIALSELITELELKLPPERSTIDVIVDREKLLNVCHELTALLKDDDLTAGKLLETNIDLLKAAFPLEFSSIEAAIRAFDFEAALATLELAKKQYSMTTR